METATKNLSDYIKDPWPRRAHVERREDHERNTPPKPRVSGLTARFDALKINELTALAGAVGHPPSENFNEFMVWLHKGSQLLKAVGIDMLQEPILVQTLLGPLNCHMLGFDDDVTQMLKRVVQKHFKLSSELATLKGIARLPGEAPAKLANKTQTYIRFTGGSANVEDLKQIVLEALPPGVSEWMNAWCENGGRDVPWDEWIAKIETAVKQQEGTPVSELHTQLGQWKTEGPGYSPRGRGRGWRGRGLNRGRGGDRDSAWVPSGVLKQENLNLKGEIERLQAQLQACMIGKESQQEKDKTVTKVARATVLTSGLNDPVATDLVA